MRVLAFVEVGVPAPGSQVAVTGRVDHGYDIRGLNPPLPAGVTSGTVLVESSHRVID